MGRQNKVGYEYESDYEDFAIWFDYENGILTKQKELLIVHDSGKTNKTEKSPIDILQIAIQCKKCNTFMDFVRGNGWVNGKYVCPVCSGSVSESDSINALTTNSLGNIDIFGEA